MRQIKNNKVVKQAASVLMTSFGRLKALCRPLTTRSENIIVLESFGGQSIACSPKAIHRAMVQDVRFSNFRFVWSVKEPENYPPCPDDDPRTTLVRTGSDEHLRALKMSKVWVVNSMLPRSKQPSSKQVYVQTWHGTPFKKLRADLTVQNVDNQNDAKSYQRINWVDVPRYSLMFAQSDYSSEKFRSAFELDEYGKGDALHAIGLPRNDALFNVDPKKIQAIKESLGLPPDKKIVLYAPTWRDDSKKSGNNRYAESTGVDTEALAAALGDEYQLLVRSHYYVQKDDTGESLLAKDVSDVDDVNDLYLISDALITDYSSVFFDYALLDRPIYFLMKDLDEYQNQIRGLYFGIEDLPGPVFQDEQAVAAAVLDVTNPHPKRTFPFEHVYDDGNASKRALDLIFQEIMKKNNGGENN